MKFLSFFNSKLSFISRHDSNINTGVTLRPENTIKKEFKFRTHPAFTLIELIITVAIITVLASIVIVNSRKADAQLRVGNFAHELAYKFKVAQSAATNIAVGSQGYGGLGNVSTFGIHIPSDNSSVIYFSEDSYEPQNLKNIYYDGADNEIAGNKFTIPSDLKISRVCVGRDEVTACNPGASSFYLNVSYSRPQLQAIFKTPRTQGGGMRCDGASTVEIEVRSNSYPELKKYIIIQQSGLIYTSNQEEFTDYGENC